MNRQVLIFGTSNTLGCFDAQGGWADRLKQYCNQQCLVNPDYWCLVYNLGVSGNTSADLVKRFKPEATARHRDTKSTAILFDVGTNDSLYFNRKRQHWVSPEDYEQNLRKLVTQARRLAPQLFFKKLAPVYQPAVDPVPWVPEASYRTAEVDRYNEILTRVVDNEKVPLIDPRPAFTEPLERCFVDGVHPTTEVHEKIYGIIRDALRERGVV